MAERGTMYGASLGETVQAGGGQTEAAAANVSELASGGDTFVGWVCGAHQTYIANTDDNPYMSWDDSDSLNAGVDKSTNNYGCFAVASAGTGTTQQSVYAGSDTKVKTNHSFGMRFDSTKGDVNQSSTGVSTTTSSTAQTKATANITPSTTGYYLIVASAMTKHGSTTSGSEHWTQLQVTSDPSGTPSDTNYNQKKWLPHSTTQEVPWVSVVRVQLTGGTEYDVKVEYWSNDGSTTAEIRDAWVVLIRLDTFKNHYYYENGGGRGRVGVTSDYTTYTTYVTANPTIANSGNHLIIAGMTLDGSVGKKSYARLQQDPSGTPTSQYDGYITPTTTSSPLAQNDQHDILVMMKANLSSGASGTNTWQWEAARTSAPGSAGCWNGAICVIELDQVSTEKTVFLGRLAGMSDVVLADG